MSEPEMDGAASTAVVDSLVRGGPQTEGHTDGGTDVSTDAGAIARAEAKEVVRAEAKEIARAEAKEVARAEAKEIARAEAKEQREQANGGVLARVRSLLPEFTGALRRVAEQVLTDPAAASRATIVELAERSGTSPATVTRFCRALGFEGYADLRLGIAAETGRARSAGWTVDIGREIQPGDPLERVLGQIMAADTQAMHDTAALLDLGEVERAAVAIAEASRVNIYGASGSALVGEEMQFSLHRIGVPVWAWTDVHNGLASAALSRPGDVALGISHSGETGETIEMLAEASSRGAVTIALTSFPRSPLADVADVVLLTATQATTFRPDALSARHPQLVVLDLLYVAVAQRTHERSHAAFQRTAQAVHGHKAAKDAGGG
jgi:DNA-binding MurR/RpiR family transcriptional regulator